MIRYLRHLISTKIIQVVFAKPIKEKKKYVISEKNPWLNPKDNFGKFERGKS